MSEISDKKLTVIELFQKWMSTRNPLEIGTKFLIDEQDKTITLIECEGYPKGKFIDNDGEDFDIAMNPDFKFIQIVKDKNREESSFYDEDVWDAFDTARNGTKVIKKENGKPVYDEYGNPIYEIMKDAEGKDVYDEDGNPIYVREPFKIKDEKKPIILRGFGKEQKNESYHEVEYYDVTKIIEELLNHVDKMETIESQALYNSGIKNVKGNKALLKKVMKLYNYPVLTKDRLYFLFRSCSFRKTIDPEIMKIEKNGEFIGYLIYEDERYIFAPKSRISSNEYSYEENQAIGFYCTADSYLDIALESIKDYNEKFMILYHNDPSKNKSDPGYQASSTIKTLLAFSCECYLKSLLLNNGIKVYELKNLGHSLVNLFASLDEKMIAKVFEFMQIRNYDISLNEPIYEANDLTDKFMIDLANNDDAFENLRYSAEFEKNTDYSFLYKFALALRTSSNSEYMTFSPFTEFIETNIKKNHR